MPDLRQLRTFLAVAEQLSFTRAAEQLHLTQQTVSKAISELERELGVALLERTTREVRLTPAGAALLESGPTALAAADAAFARAREVGAGTAGVVRVGVSPAIGLVDREAVVAALQPAGSDVSISFHEVRPSELRPMLRSRQIEIALTRISGADEPALHQTPLRPTPAILCVPDDHRLASAEAVRLSELDGERLLLPSAPGTPYTDLLLARLEAVGATVTPIEARATGGGVILTQLRQHAAVALAPVGDPLTSGVVAMPVEDFTLPLLLLWPAGLPSTAVERVREAMGPRRPAGSHPGGRGLESP
jgi:DNA-binding transcriptional LysR family regulator